MLKEVITAYNRDMGLCTSHAVYFASSANLFEAMLAVPVRNLRD